MSMTRDEIAKIFPDMVAHFVPQKAQGVEARIQFDLSGDNGGSYWMSIKDGAATTGEGKIERPQMVIRATADDYAAMTNGDLNPMQAFMSGRVKIQGDMGMAMRFMNMFNM